MLELSFDITRMDTVLALTLISFSFLSLFSEFENPYQERQRIPGSFSSHGYRLNEYGSSSPTKGELDDCSRGISGRWESRSSGRSDKDTDSQCDRDSGTD